MSVKKYLHRKVTLLSTSDVRYEGDLYSVDPSEQSIALKHVNCMGTEGRRTGDQAIAPSDCTYEFIIFRAVNIRELWLEDGNRQVDLTDEVLVPLRGQNASNASKQQDDAPGPKRKVGYQSRSGQQAQTPQGYADAYQAQAQPYGYDTAYGAYGQRAAAAYAERGAYPPLPANQQGYYAAPQSYYDTPNQAYYGGGGGQGGYNRQQQGYGGGYQRQRGYERYDRQQQQGYGYQQGYQRQRQAQYYNQGRSQSQYYDQGGYQQQQYYGQQRRPQQYNNRQGYNRGYQQQQGYNRGYQQQRQQPQRRGGDGDGRAGTGAYLDNRRLRGDEIDIKDQQDFDFGAAKSEFDHLKDGYVNAEDLEKEQAAVAAAASAAESKAESAAAAEDTKADDAESKKYDRNLSFFDGLQTETKKSKPKQDMQTQKDVDSETFGSVAVSYKSRHVNPQQQGQYYRSQQQNRGRAYFRPQQQQQQRYSQGYSQRSQSYRQQPQQQYQTSKWVARR